MERFALEVWEITVGDPGTLQELVPPISSDLKFISYLKEVINYNLITVII